MLEPAFVIAFIVYFVKATTWKGMIFFGVKQKLEGLPEFFKKPLFSCPVCMTPWWGAAIYLIAHYYNLTGFEELTLPRLIFTVFISSGINTIFLLFNKLYDVNVRSFRRNDK
ncbi:MAG: hypothetical protein ACK4ND_08215 [Cytophagaceae bacterium]